MERLEDEVLADGEKLAYTIEALPKCLIRAESAIAMKDDVATKSYLGAVRFNWGILCELTKKYPNSELIRREVKEARKYAKGILPRKVYREIYEKEYVESEDE